MLSKIGNFSRITMPLPALFFCSLLNRFGGQRLDNQQAKRVVKRFDRDAGFPFALLGDEVRHSRPHLLSRSDSLGRAVVKKAIPSRVSTKELVGFVEILLGRLAIETGAQESPGKEPKRPPSNKIQHDGNLSTGVNDTLSNENHKRKRGWIAPSPFS